MNRAYSVVTVKRVQEERREIEGIATSPAVDRVGDVIDPMGVRYKNPLPLLWQHDHSKPVGTVEFSAPTSKGVRFRAKLATVDEPGTLQDRVNEAWQSIKTGLVRAVSIGFRALDEGALRMPGGGFHYVSIEVVELSLVTIPANEQALISTIKRYDLDPDVRAVPSRKPPSDRKRLEGEIAAAEKRAVEIEQVIRRCESGDYSDADAGKYSNSAYQAAHTARGVISKRLSELQERYAAVLAGDPDPGGEEREKTQAPRTSSLPPRPPVAAKKKVTSSLVAPEIDRGLVGMGARDVAQVLGIPDAESKSEADWGDLVEQNFRGNREAFGADNPAYSFDAATYATIKKLIAWGLSKGALDKAVGGTLRREVETKLTKRIGALGARIHEIEGSAFKYMGVYQRAQAYPRGAGVTFGGSVWIAAKDTVLPPGTPEGRNDWTLAIKRGRDGKDGEQ